MSKPNCYKCKWRRDIPGDAHSSCEHPQAAFARDDPTAGLRATLATVARVEPIQADALNVAGHPHGIKNGWFCWPWNFDPTWLLNCDGFEKK